MPCQSRSAHRDNCTSTSRSQRRGLSANMAHSALTRTISVAQWWAATAPVSFPPLLSRGTCRRRRRRRRRRLLDGDVCLFFFLQRCSEWTWWDVLKPLVLLVVSDRYLQMIILSVARCLKIFVLDIEYKIY